MFSDNICISIPYNENDFLNKFRVLALFIIKFQNLMMLEGFFIRGGVSLGSYYSDNHIIFSGGLVKSYLLESKKAIYPRVILDSEIISLIENSKVSYPKMLISDWEGLIFLNPFGLKDILKSLLVENMDAMLAEASEELKSKVNNLRKETYEIIIVDSDIKDSIDLNMSKTDIDSVKSKYIWCQELIKWIENKKSALKFNYF
jgi:hypothetical protein